MLITVAICTFNRAASLRRTLDSLVAMHLPEGLDWEVVVVNNNCTDSTDEVISTFTERLPIRRAFEPQQGHSKARNRAIEEARGEYIVWTDDDVIVAREWLAAYAEAFRQWPDGAVFGGPIIPLYEEPVVPWVVQSEELLGGPWAIRDLGDLTIPLSLDGHRIPYGANFVVRAKEQRHFLFDSELGLDPVRRRLGDETDVIARILNSGASGYWIPEAGVRHCIGHDRQTVRYLKRYFAGMGETEAYQAARAGTAEKLWFGVPRWLWRQTAVGWIGYHVHRFLSPAPVWVRHLRNYSLASSAVRFWLSTKGPRGGEVSTPKSS